MSLIADALKAAQRERTVHAAPSPAPAASRATFLPTDRKRARPKDGLPRSLTYTLIALGAAGVIAAFVALLLSGTPRDVVVGSNPLPVIPPTQIPSATPLPAATSPYAIAAPPIEQSAPAVAAAAPKPFADATAPAAPAPISSEASALPVAAGSASDRATDTPAADADATESPRAERRPKGKLTITLENPSTVNVESTFQAALSAQKRGDFARARDLYAKAIESDGGNANLHNNLGSVYRAMGDLDRAEEEFRRAIRLDSHLAAAWSNLGVLLDSRGRNKEAISALEQSSSIDPSNVGTKVNLALQYHAAGLYANARKLLEEALRARPALPEAHYALAKTLEAQGEKVAAIEQYSLFLTTGRGRFPQLERQVSQHLVSLKSGL